MADTGTTHSFIAASVVEKHKLEVVPSSIKVSLASGNVSNVLGECKVNIQILGKTYKMFKFIVMNNLVAPVILGHDWFNLFSSVIFYPRGKQPGVSIPGITPAA